MNEIEFFASWEKIDKIFFAWYKGQSWDEEVQYLSRLMCKEFKLTKIQVEEIFEQFNKLFTTDDCPIHFDWKNYQLPALMIISAKIKYLKLKKK